jgi:hypothetical protein
MALQIGTVRITTTAEPRVHSETVADLFQLSGVTAISIIGICLSLMVLTVADRGEWLVAIANGF